MKILLTNDDGVFAPGLICLAEELAPYGEITVVAPDRDRSGSSNSLTLDRPLRSWRTDRGFYAVAGTPTDCVHLATQQLLTEPPDVLISGINGDANLGDDVFYSGTVAAALEARLLGRPSLAVSLARKDTHHECTHYKTAAVIVAHMLKHWSQLHLTTNQILSLNVPDIPQAQLKGIQVTRLGYRHRAEPMIRMQDPKGRTVYWLGPPGPGQDAGPGTDFHAIEHNYASITPLHIDLTAHEALATVHDWAGQLSL